MKILEVSNFFKPLWKTGGVTRVNYQISYTLVKNGHDVTVYTTDGYDSTFEIKKNCNVDVDGIKVYYFKNLFKYITSKINLTIPYYLPFVLSKEIWSFDIIHIHEHRTLPAVFVHYYAKKHGIPYVLQSHGSVLPYFQNNTLKKLFDYLFGYSILHDASRVIALTEIEAKQYVQMGVDKSRIAIISNGINIDEFSNLPSKGEFKKKYSISNDTKIILYLGRIDKIKGIDLLIDAFSMLNTKLDNILLVIVGPNSSYLTNLKRQVNDLGLLSNVLFTGPLYERDKLEAYVDTNVYVLPSRYETFPITVLEAAACGVPVIVTDKCGISDIVDSKFGQVVEYDEEKLCSSMFEILNNDRLISEHYTGCIKIPAQYDWNIIMRKLENIYVETVKLTFNILK